MAAINAGARSAIVKQTAEAEIANLRSVEAAQARAESNKRAQIRLTAETQKAASQFSRVFTPDGRPLALDPTASSRKEREIEKALHQYRKDSDAELHNKRMAQANREREIAKALHQYRKDGDTQQRNARAAHLIALSREEREIAKALYQYRKDGDAQQHNARMAQLRVEAAAFKDAVKFSSIMTPGGKPLQRESTPPTKINVSAGLRAGAGIAGALGAYPAAGTLYAAANALQMIGLSSVSAAAGLSAVAVALPVAVGVGLLLFGKEFNIELARMSTLLASATTSTSDFKSMLNQAATSAVKLSSEFNIGLVDVVKAFKDALSAGIDASDLERFTRGAAELSTSLGVGLSEATNILTSFKDSYHLTITELAKVNDILFNTVDEGKVNVNDLVNNFGRLLPIGKAAGIAIEDLAAGVAVMTRRGLTASQSITSMTQLINGIISPSDKAKRAFDAMGIATGDAAFMGRSFLEVLTEISVKTGGSGELIGKLFPEERGKRGAAILSDALDLLGKTRDSIDELGTAAVASDRAMDTLWANLGQSIKSVTGPLRQVGSDFADTINDIIYGSDALQKTLKESAKSVSETGKIIATSFLSTGMTDRFALEQELVKSIGDIGVTHSGPTGYSPTPITYIKNMQQIKDAVTSALAEYKDASIIILRDADTSFLQLDAKLKEAIENRPSIKGKVPELSKAQSSDFDRRATDEQSRHIEYLELELELINEKIEKEKELIRIDTEKSIAARKTTYLAGPREALELAHKGGDTKTIQEAEKVFEEAQRNIENFITRLRTSVNKSPVFYSLQQEAETLIDTINRVHTAVRTQDTDAGRDFEARLRAEKDEVDKEQAEEQVKLKKDYNAIVEELYKADLAAYEKVEKKKEQINKASTDKINKETKKSLALQAEIMNNILGAQANIYKDDPSAQARLGRSRRDEVKTKLDNAAVSGGSREQFDSLVKQYQEASDLVRSGTTGAGDSRRADRNYIEDQSILSAINATFDKVFQQRERMNAQRNVWSQGSATVRSPQEIAKAAMEVQQQQIKVEQVVLDAKIKLDIVGNIPDATMNKLSEMVIDKINKAQRNRNRTSSYDTSDREDSTITAE